MEIKDAVAVVSGGASGLGLATAKRLLDAGARVVVIDLKGEEVVAELGDRAKFVATGFSFVTVFTALRPRRSTSRNLLARCGSTSTAQASPMRSRP